MSDEARKTYLLTLVVTNVQFPYDNFDIGKAAKSALEELGGSTVVFWDTEKLGCTPEQALKSYLGDSSNGARNH